LTFPLFLGLPDPADEPAVLENILQDLERRKWHFNVGVLGTKYQNTASAGFQPDTNLNTIRSLVPGKTVSVALSSSAIFAAN
jgi:hypothetical protein